MGASGVVTFLKKLGMVIVDGAAIAVGLQPIIQPMLGSAKPAVTTVTNDLSSIAQLVTMIETALHGQAGTAKLQALIPLVKSVISTSELVSGKKIANEALFTQGCTEVGQGVVDILNSISQNEVKTA